MEVREKVFAKSRIFELVQIEQEDGRMFEIARRAPGVRLIIADKEKREILLTKEFRREINGYDYRLPGGKVFDLVDEYNAFLESKGDIRGAAMQKGKEEGLQEAGIEILELEEFKVSTLGATMEWDLFVFEVTDWRSAEGGQQLEVGEQIEADNWFGYEEIERMIMNGEMQEERIALILLQWITKQRGGDDEV